MQKSVKQQVRDLLEEKDCKGLIELSEKHRQFWNELRFRLYDIDERLRWAAIECAAKFIQRLWKKGQKEKVRDYVRNLFWSLNDESGGIGWSAPQTIAEIIINIPELLEPYGSIMISHTLEEPFLIKGGLWGIGRLGKQIAESVEFFREKILAAFENDDPEILCLAAWAMGEVGFKQALPFLKKLSEGKERVRIYICGDCHEKSLGEWASEAIAKIEGNT